jgi:predicted LPLAT superfamily acyltransferase
MQQKDFSKKRGNKPGFWFFKTSLKIFGLSGAYGLLYIVCLYYLLFDRSAVSSSMAYIKRRFKTYNAPQKIYCIYQLFINQGKHLIDRFYVISGLGEFNMELQGYDRIRSLLSDSKKGAILLTAHVGNWQVTMTALKRLGKSVYLLMSPEENAAVKNALDIDSDQGQIRIISTDDFLGGAVEVIKAIDEGNLVSVMGDRSEGYDSTEVYFLGEKARFPYGAFSIAAAAQCPVIVLLSAKISKKKYMVDITRIIFPKYSSRDKKHEDIRSWVQEYAGILEDYATKYPLQWFIFRDIWIKNLI